jgi:hypothetical protein
MSGQASWLLFAAFSGSLKVNESQGVGQKVLLGRGCDGRSHSIQQTVVFNFAQGFSIVCAW